MSEDARVATATEGARDDARVPTWLAVLVIVLLIGVIAAATFAVRAALLPSSQRTGVVGAQTYDIDVARKASDADPSSAKLRLDLAFAYQRAGEFDKAEAEYSKVLTSDPKNVTALYNVGVIAALQGDTAKAEKAFRSVVAIEPTHALAAGALAREWLDAGRAEQVVALLEPVVKANPEAADLRFLLGSAFEKTGQAKRAIDQYRAALRFSPELTAARRGLERLGATQ